MIVYNRYNVLKLAHQVILQYEYCKILITKPTTLALFIKALEESQANLDHSNTNYCREIVSNIIIQAITLCKTPITEEDTTNYLCKEILSLIETLKKLDGFTIGENIIISNLKLDWTIREEFKGIYCVLDYYINPFIKLDIRYKSCNNKYSGYINDCLISEDLYSLEDLPILEKDLIEKVLVIRNDINTLEKYYKGD